MSQSAESIADFVTSKAREWNAAPVIAKFFPDYHCSQVADHLAVKLSVQKVPGDDIAHFEGEIPANECFQGLDWINGFVLLRKKSFDITIQAFREIGNELSSTIVGIVYFETTLMSIEKAEFEAFLGQQASQPAYPSVPRNFGNPPLSSSPQGQYPSLDASSTPASHYLPSQSPPQPENQGPDTSWKAPNQYAPPANYQAPPQDQVLPQQGNFGVQPPRANPQLQPPSGKPQFQPDSQPPQYAISKPHTPPASNATAKLSVPEVLKGVEDKIRESADQSVASLRNAAFQAIRGQSASLDEELKQMKSDLQKRIEASKEAGNGAEVSLGHVTKQAQNTLNVLQGMQTQAPEQELARVREIQGECANTHAQLRAKAGEWSQYRNSQTTSYSMFVLIPIQDQIGSDFKLVLVSFVKGSLTNMHLRISAPQGQPIWHPLPVVSRGASTILLDHYNYFSGSDQFAVCVVDKDNKQVSTEAKILFNEQQPQQPASNASLPQNFPVFLAAPSLQQGVGVPQNSGYAGNSGYPMPAANPLIPLQAGANESQIVSVVQRAYPNRSYQDVYQAVENCKARYQSVTFEGVVACLNPSY